MSLKLKHGRYGGDSYTWKRRSNILLRMEVGGGLIPGGRWNPSNIKQRFTTRSDKLVALELHYRTHQGEHVQRNIIPGLAPRNIPNDTREGQGSW